MVWPGRRRVHQAEFCHVARNTWRCYFPDKINNSRTMKAVVIGGGIAGLAVARFLSQQKFEVVVNERSEGLPTRGNAFMVAKEAISVLQNLNYPHQGPRPELPGKTVQQFCLKRPSGKDVMYQKIDPWTCMRREDLIKYLHAFTTEGQVKFGRKFKCFRFDGARAVAAEFENGEVEYGDFFIGADGGNSAVRTAIFGQTNYTAIEVKEIVGVAHNAQIAVEYSGLFTKIQSNVKGVSFGFIPATEKEIVWFMQWDVKLGDLPNSSPTPEEMFDFCHKTLNRFPPIVKELVTLKDIGAAYVWNTRDFNLLPSFHRDNVVLIGDAAHLALPFTSAGTSNALTDAMVLANALCENSELNGAFAQYYAQRAKQVGEQVEFGRAMKRTFLNPVAYEEAGTGIPLISSKSVVHSENETVKIADRPKMQLIYYTDPICSSCWSIQPQLRKLMLEYGHMLQVDYRLGGLLPSWDKYESKTIKKPLDAAFMWEESADMHNMPIHGDIWINDPLSSSYPPSVAFKAAQLQNPEAAVEFLRRLREFAFLEKKNISKMEHIIDAAFESGLDIARLKRDYEGIGVVLFKQDLDLAREMGVDAFPTLIFSENGLTTVLKGHLKYEDMEKAILELRPEAIKNQYARQPMRLFDTFRSISSREASFLLDCPYYDTVNMLNTLYIHDEIDKYVTRNGSLWIKKTNNNTTHAPNYYTDRR
ncbi:MAG: hypothetical protein EBZ77_06380 [Chitinophagia bacterium]|nr:hypothetical protein [Chitinophagia bacterium]